MVIDLTILMELCLYRGPKLPIYMYIIKKTCRPPKKLKQLVILTRHYIVRVYIYVNIIFTPFLL